MPSETHNSRVYTRSCRIQYARVWTPYQCAINKVAGVLPGIVCVRVVYASRTVLFFFPSTGRFRMLSDFFYRLFAIVASPTELEQKNTSLVILFKRLFKQPLGSVSPVVHRLAFLTPDTGATFFVLEYARPYLTASRVFSAFLERIEKPTGK